MKTNEHQTLLLLKAMQQYAPRIWCRPLDIPHRRFVHTSPI